VILDDLLDKVREYAPNATLDPIVNAYFIAAKAHDGQTRKSGEPYLHHPMSVAMILADMGMDIDTIATGLLHDALEDNPLSYNDLEKQVGETIATMVDGVTKIGKLQYKSKEELAAENFRKMMIAMSKDIRIILVKLADRLHNMSTLDAHSPEKQKLISRETREVYVPIANRLGLVRFKMELADLCFRYLEPIPYAEVSSYLSRTQDDRESYIQTVCGSLRKLLEEHGVVGDVTGRAKATYGIYRKMRSQHLEVDQVLDTLAFRIVFSDLSQCYAFLGLIHGLFLPVPGRIKDYIARPKPNGYQSLHTTVMGPLNRPIEVQLRTQEMHRLAEQGIASHWQYKEEGAELSDDDISKIGRIREAFESAQQADNATDFMAAFKVELYANEVFVFTPAGDIKPLPSGSTPIDFAFSIHSEVGFHCTGARVDGKLVPLRYKLKTGQTIEIITSPTQKPTRDWLAIAKSGRALQRIRQYLRSEKLELGQRIGKEMLVNELRRTHHSIRDVKDSGRLQDFLGMHDLKRIDKLYIELAHGRLSLTETARTLAGIDQTKESEDKKPKAISGFLSRWKGTSTSPVLISGEDGVLVSFSKCCGPLPGEQVVGFITRGRGITVHRRNCSQLKTLDQKRQIPVEWDNQSVSKHPGELEIHCQDRPGLLANITKVCDIASVNIIRADAHHLSVDQSICTLEVAVTDVRALRELIIKIGKIDGVDEVIRKRR
jgi:GTP pyrophosphokinase